MSDKLPVLVIITAADCSACNSLHSSGDFSRDTPVNPKATFYGHKWETSLFWKLITGTPNPDTASVAKFRVFEIELFSMRNNNMDGVRCFTEFTLNHTRDRTEVTRVTTFRGEANTDIAYIIKDSQKYEEGKSTGKNFSDEVKAAFPSSLSPLVVQFPSFIWISASEWRKALASSNLEANITNLKGGYVPYAKVFSLIVGEKDYSGTPGWGIIAREKPGEGITDPILAAQFIITNGLSPLDPPPLKGIKEVPIVKKISDDKTSEICPLSKIRIVPMGNRYPFYSRRG